MDAIIQGGHRLICFHPDIGNVPASGVAILIHEKFVKSVKKKHLISDRLMAVDLLLGSH